MAQFIVVLIAVITDVLFEIPSIAWAISWPSFPSPILFLSSSSLLVFIKVHLQDLEIERILVYLANFSAVFGYPSIRAVFARWPFRSMGRVGYYHILYCCVRFCAFSLFDTSVLCAPIYCMVQIHQPHAMFMLYKAHNHLMLIQSNF